MTRCRNLARLLVVIALLATGLALAVAAPTGGQSTLRVFDFRSAETDDEWQVQITAQALGGCRAGNARSGIVTAWMAPGDVESEVFNPATCTYRITAAARRASVPNELCRTELRWGTEGDFQTEPLLTSKRADAPTTVEVKHVEDGGEPDCSPQPRLSVTIDPAAVVETLPESSTDPVLADLAARAVAITEFRVRVTPTATSIGRTDCDRTLEFAVKGGDAAAEKALGSIGSAICEFRITITEAPPPLAILNIRGKTFSTGVMEEGTGLIAVDVSDLVVLPVNRITIIQNVVNNPTNAGIAAYRVDSDCGGVGSLPPIARPTGSHIYTLPGGETVVSLNNGRFTVHKPGFANFGPDASYPAVATSTVSNAIRGCSVTATIDLAAPGCTLAGPSTRTLTWTSANALTSFDFEFKIDCHDVPSPEPEVSPPPQPTDDPEDTSTGDSDTDALVGSPDVRIVARLLDDGDVEFGLQQQQEDGSWGDRILPRARLFPVATPAGRWLVSSPVTLSVAELADDLATEATVRITARKRDDGKVEFGLQQQENGSWSDPMLPSRRLFPPTTAIDLWLVSSTLTLDV
ncbi:MAG: hypothetical protein OXH28_00430 [bacterium]|nr:hypothetical protein [bacterium]